VERLNDVFKERIAIDGMGKLVLFTFRMLNGEYGTEYKVRTDNPECDFNMRNTMGEIRFAFDDNADLPEWLMQDTEAQTKLSSAIVTGSCR
jgi:hypothetical protein